MHKNKIKYLYYKNYFRKIGKKCYECNKGMFLEDTNWKSDWYCWRTCSRCGLTIKAFLPKEEEDLIKNQTKVLVFNKNAYVEQ